MKKIFCCAAAAALTVGGTAFAADIDAHLILRKADVTVTDTLGVQTPTVQLLNAEKTKVLYADEGRLENGSYLFDSFSFPMDAQSGSYILRVGENGKITEISVKYTSYDEGIRALETIKNDKSKISAQISAYPELFQTTAADYQKLGSAWKNRLDKEISEMDIKCSNEEEATESLKQIAAAVQKITSWSMLTESSDEKETEKAIAAIPGLDLKYRDKLSSLSGLPRAFAAQNLDVMNIDENGILSAFDGAMLVNIISACDWGTGKEALNYYAGKGLLTIDAEYLSKGADVYKELKNKGITDYTKIPQAMRDICNTPNNPGSGSGSGGGGGSGSGSGGTSVGKVNSAASGISAGNAPSGSAAETEKNVFNDLSGAEWARTAVEALAEKNIVSGRGNGSFAPNDTITRAEFVKLIVTAFGLEDDTAETEFEDVPKTAWSYRYISSAKKAGIIFGMTDSYFGASEPISRQDMAVILLRTAELNNIDTSGSGTEFADSVQISDYAKEAVERLSAAGVIKGMNDGTFSPLTDVTRAQGAQVIYTMLCRKG